MYTLDLHSLRFYQRALRSLMSPLHSRLVSWSLSPQGKGMSIPNPCTSYRDLVWRTCINSVYGLHTGYFLTLCWSPIREGTFGTMDGLPWLQDITSAPMFALQYRHGAPPQYGAICWGLLSSGFSWPLAFIWALPVHSLPMFAHQIVFCVFRMPWH